ncbi:MAG TPA: phosphoribosyltransferase family protein [Vicinamibacterales bacterium]|nr:phosphoribosyltransferase family protein [Vicinamibacterales bacterium]
MTEAQPKILIASDALRQRVAELAQQISADYEGRDLTIVCTLGGAVVFFADLVRQLTIPARHVYMGFSAYGGGGGKSGEARVYLDVAEPLEGRHVLVLDGTVISGRTPHYILELLQRRQPASLKFCTLLLKRGSLRAPLPLDYVGFEVPDEGFAVGYGMGQDPAHRWLPYIGTVSA